MRVLYFSKDYSPHDHRFLSALAETEHEVFYLKLEQNLRQIEDRPVPSQIQQVLWKGGQRFISLARCAAPHAGLEACHQGNQTRFDSRRPDSNLCVPRGALRLSSHSDHVVGL